MLDHPDTLGGPYFDRDLIGPDGRLNRFCKGQSAPKQTATQKKAELKNLELMEKMLNQKPEKMPEINIPPAPEPVAIPPAPSQSSADVEDADQEARRAAGKRYGLLRTTYAGATGGYGGSKPLGGVRSLLG